MRASIAVQRGDFDLAVDPQLMGALGAAEFARQKGLAALQSRN